MLLYSVWLGNRHYYIPYNWHRICRYVTVGVLLFAVSVILQNVPGIENSLVVKLGINTVLILIYMAYVLRVNGGLAKIIGK
jgi:sulfite exporter TauE/SafE